MASTDSDRVVFMAGCDGPLAHSLVGAISGPGVKLALHAEYRKGIDHLIDLARGRGATAISVSDEATEPDRPLLRPAAERCIRELGRIDLAVQADGFDASSFPRSICDPENVAWWPHAWTELRTAAELVAGVAPFVARGGRLVVLTPALSAEAGPLFAAAAAAFESLLPAARAELESAGVGLVAVPVEPFDLRDWSCFGETPSSIVPVAGRVVSAATA